MNDWTFEKVQEALAESNNKTSGCVLLNIRENTEENINKVREWLKELGYSAFVTTETHIYVYPIFSNK